MLVIRKGAEKFVLANCSLPQVVMLLFEDYKIEEDSNVLQKRLLAQKKGAVQVSETQN